MEVRAGYLHDLWMGHPAAFPFEVGFGDRARGGGLVTVTEGRREGGGMEASLRCWGRREQIVLLVACWAGGSSPTGRIKMVWLEPGSSGIHL